PYRQKVILENLRKSFPLKGEKELNVLKKKTYRNLCDLIVESVKAFSISAKQLRRRMKISNPELLEKYYQQGKSVIVVTSHYGNWEWGGMASPFVSRHRPVAIYL